MMLFLVSLSLLGVSAASLGAIKDSAERSLGMRSFHDSAISLSNAMDEVCAVGDGNRREVIIAKPMGLSPQHTEDGWVVRFTMDGSELSLIAHSLCETGGDSLEAGAYMVENDGGIIKITKR
ncbi:MAG: hypothetical protein AB1295_03720 [Candidatus Micrarchaeota archaeon]